MRNSFSKNIIALTQKSNNTAFILTGDHGYALFDEFRKECQAQYLNAGIAEQNMIGVGAGLSKSGLYPMMYGLSAFLPIRVLEQIKLDFCYENLPGLFVGDGAGVVYSALGTSHQSTEDISALRAIPNMKIYSPTDALEMDAVFKFIGLKNAPVYLRMGKSDLGDVHKTEPKLIEGQPFLIREGVAGAARKIAFLATGSMVQPALKLATAEFKDASVWSVPFLKPFDASFFRKSFSSYDSLITFEEHSIMGGLGSLVCEAMSELPARQGPSVLRLGINDQFSKFCGSYAYLLKEHGIDEASLKSKIVKFLSL